MFLLDTDHIGIIQRQTAPEFTRLSGRMAAHLADAFFVSIVSFHEQVGGWSAYLNRAKTPQETVRAYRMFEQILADFSAMQVLPFDDQAAERFEQFRTLKIRAATMDMRIASIASARGMTVLTRNRRDFEKFPGLAVEDWTA